MSGVPAAPGSVIDNSPAGAVAVAAAVENAVASSCVASSSDHRLTDRIEFIDARILDRLRR